MARKQMAMVMEIKGEYAVVLTREGTFERIKTPPKGCHIGDEILVEVGNSFSFNVLKGIFNKSKYLGYKNKLVPALGVCGVLIFSIVSWASPIGYVYMDVNPSLAIGYNLYERVVSLESFNDDGKVIEETVSVYGKSIEDTVEASLLAMNEKGFVKEEASGLILGFSNASETIKEKTISAVTHAVDKTQKSIEVGSVSVDKTQMKQAKVLGATPIEVAIATEKVGKNSGNTNVKAAVDSMKNQGTAEIIKENPSVVKVKNMKLEQIKKNIEQKKAKLKELSRPKKDILKETLKETSQEMSKEMKETQNSTVIEVTKEEGMDFSEFEIVKNRPMGESVEALKRIQNNLEQLKEKLENTKLEEKEKVRRLEQVNRQLQKVSGLIQRLELEGKPSAETLEKTEDKTRKETQEDTSKEGHEKKKSPKKEKVIRKKN